MLIAEDPYPEPYNPDDVGEALLSCDRCSELMLWEDDCHEKGYAIKQEWHYTIFKGVMKPGFLHGDFCEDCAKKMTPFVWRLREVYRVINMNNKLYKAISNAKNQNHGAA